MISIWFLMLMALLIPAFVAAMWMVHPLLGIVVGLNVAWILLQRPQRRKIVASRRRHTPHSLRESRWSA